ncbi:MAG: YmdB family metallophosphoesterase, partial [Candidatus Cloacimonetes bacterium]|nr:YmdB family metallophosphoesterase [Candidatus Cloacimonadota bacterium]
IDLFTSGNHLWDQKDAFSYLETEPRILKPANYPAAALGNEYYLHSFPDNNKVAVVSLIGQAFMGPANSPFETIDRLLPLLHQETRVVIVDFHAEATAEKRALGFYLDGRVSCLIGTHTHVQTADEEILPGGTAYLTDVGMTGPHDSVIGIEKEIILKKLLSGMPYRYEVASNGLEINALFIEIEQKSGKAIKIERIKRKIS